MERKLKVAVACGGTGGHAFPGLAVAETLSKRGHDVVVWDSGRDIESSVMRSWKGSVFSTGARQLSLKNLPSIWFSLLRCRKEIKRSRPDVMIAMGSYSSLPPVLAARVEGVPVVMHEANTIPGRAVDFLARYAKVVAISFEGTAKLLKGTKTVRTGLPVRNTIASGKRFGFIPDDAFVVFVTGGSQGAHMVNCIASEAIVIVKNELERRPQPKGRSLYVIHQTGVKDEPSVTETYVANSIPARVRGFETEMADAFASADLVIARAGASTCFELAACGKPAMLIPLPSAMRDHQHFNADEFAAKGAADEGIQDNLAPHQLARYILDKMDNPGKLAQMAAKMKELSVPDAAERVADLVEKAAAGDFK